LAYLKHRDSACMLGHAYNMHAHFSLVCRNLQRYMHYNGRWEAHVASQKLET